VENYSFISVDLQNDFASKGGKGYTYKPSIDFLKKEIFPCFQRKNIKVNEIISDYRQPRPGDRGDLCYPGTWGYESILPSKLRKSLWIKCMNSPIWVRDNIGNPDKEPGLPYQDTKAFSEWLNKNIGKPKDVTPVVFGLTIDCCVLSTLQELNWRGYYPLVVEEAVDHRTGKREDKMKVLVSTIENWSDIVSWQDLKSKIK
jgi:nicotinamidase-related amidase